MLLETCVWQKLFPGRPSRKALSYGVGNTTLNTVP